MRTCSDKESIRTTEVATKRQPLQAKPDEACQAAVGAVIIMGVLNFQGIREESHNGRSTKNFISQDGEKGKIPYITLTITTGKKYNGESPNILDLQTPL